MAEASIGIFQGLSTEKDKFDEVPHQELLAMAFREITAELDNRGNTKELQAMRQLWAIRLIRHWRSVFMKTHEGVKNDTIRAEVIGGFSDGSRLITIETRTANERAEFTVGALDYSMRPPTIKSDTSEVSYEVVIKGSGLAQNGVLEINSFKRTRVHLAPSDKPDLTSAYITDIRTIQV